MTLPAVTLGAQTDLDAVNEMLIAIGQAPVNSLSTTGIRDLSIAVYCLGVVSRQVQSTGWWFNRDINVLLTADINTQYAVAANCLSMRFFDATRNGSIRSGFLYDSDNHTNLFPNDPTLRVDTIVMLDYNTLPQEARNYIGVRAARYFCGKVLGSPQDYKTASDDEVLALAAMKREETRNRRSNMFRTASASNRIYNRAY